MIIDVRVFKVKPGYYIKDFNHEDTEYIVRKANELMGNKEGK